MGDETHAGTNAPGTALAVGRPVHSVATEHFRSNVQNWTCVAVPIRDPATGRILGAVDITGGGDLAHTHSLALVTAAARAAEGNSAADRPRRPGSGCPISSVRIGSKSSGEEKPC